MRVFILEQQSGIARLINILGEKGFPSLVNSIKMAANEVMREWINQVKNSNTKSGFKRRYIEAINLDRENRPLESTVSAKGKFVNFVEDGIKRFDMKCIVEPKTPIYTSKGFKKIKDIKIDDLVLTHEGRFKKVKKIIITKNKDEYVYILKTKYGNITLTYNHPVLTDKGWKMICDIDTENDLIFVLATMCNNCNKIIQWNFNLDYFGNKQYCCKSCAAHINNDFRRKNGRIDLDDNARKNISKAMTKTNYRMYNDGRHVSQTGVMKKYYKSGKWGYAGLNKQQLKEYQHKAAISLGRNARGNSSPEQKFSEILNELNQKVIFSDEYNEKEYGKNIWIRQYVIHRNKFKMQFGVKKTKRLYFLDFYNPYYNVCFEINGERYHNIKQDKEKKHEIESEHKIMYISFYSKQIYQQKENIKKEIERIIMNHEDKYLFTLVKCDIEKRKKGKFSYFNKYNLNVEDDNSFVAAGIVVHNSGLLQGPHSRVSDKGIRYNIIFMRKGTPGAQHISNMSREMYTTVKKLDKEDIKRRFRTIGIGNKVDFESGSYSRKIYSSKYGRLESKGKKDIYGGMVKAGSPRHTQYGVFRVVSENSHGWIYPGIPPSPVFSKMSMKMIPIVKSMMQEGLMKDLQTGLEYFNK